MASATSLPVKSIAFTTSLLAGVTASRVDLQKLVVSNFTGPGSKSRIFAALVILANLKNVPSAWHVCFPRLLCSAPSETTAHDLSVPHIQLNAEAPRLLQTQYPTKSRALGALRACDNLFPIASLGVRLQPPQVE